MGKRIIAFFIDHIIICIALALFGMVEMFVQIDFEIFWKVYYILFLALMFVYFFKDIINGQSIGKRIMKIKVVDMGGNPPNLFKLIIRNITIMIWPVEAVLILLEKNRLGDKLAKTRIVEL